MESEGVGISSEAEFVRWAGTADLDMNAVGWFSGGGDLGEALTGSNGELSGDVGGVDFARDGVVGAGGRGVLAGVGTSEVGGAGAAAGVADAEGLSESAGVALGEDEFAGVVALGLAMAESEGAELGWPDSAGWAVVDGADGRAVVERGRTVGWTVGAGGREASSRRGVAVGSGMSARVAVDGERGEPVEDWRKGVAAGPGRGGESG